jgi:predicted PhzF superfamily epimerase YddE/YHI9
MKIVMYQVDAFTDRVFSGNPAAVPEALEYIWQTYRSNPKQP